MLETLLSMALKQLDNQENEQNSFIAWLADKKFKPHDFAVLRILKTDEEILKISEIFLKCQTLNSSFSDTTKIIETATELVMINPSSPILSNSENLTEWKIALQKLRFPQTTNTDELLKNKLETLPWPTGAKTKFERRGDRAGVELKLFISSQADLTKAISALERVKEQL